MRSEDENEKNTWFTGFHKRPGKAENLDSPREKYKKAV
jgi:hypothetical protein